MRTRALLLLAGLSLAAAGCAELLGVGECEVLEERHEVTRDVSPTQGVARAIFTLTQEFRLASDSRDCSLVEEGGSVRLVITSISETPISFDWRIEGLGRNTGLTAWEAEGHVARLAPGDTIDAGHIVHARVPLENGVLMRLFAVTEVP